MALVDSRVDLSAVRTVAMEHTGAACGVLAVGGRLCVRGALLVWQLYFLLTFAINLNCSLKNL